MYEDFIRQRIEEFRNKSLRKESKVVQTKKQYGDFSLTALSFASISIFSGWTKCVNSIWTFNYDTLFIIG